MRYGTSHGPRITVGAGGRPLINLGSNDYLGMGGERVPAAGTGRLQFQSSSRLVSGNDPAYGRLERLLARHKSQQGSLVYPTGYMANIGAIPALAGKGDLVLSDRLNHASIIDACRLSGATVVTYSHNDMDDLRAGLRAGLPGGGGRPRRNANTFVITEGVFSMDGDVAPLGEITEIAREAGAITVVDDAHGDFVMGADGRGTPHSLGVAREVGLYTSSLSKALGSFGGYVAAQGNAVDLCVNRSRPFIYTSALPSLLVDTAIRRFESGRREGRRRRLLENARRMAGGLAGIGYDTGLSATHIIPVMVGDEGVAVRMGAYLARNGVFARPIRYPTVPAGSARLRVSVTAWLSAADVEAALAAFEKAYRRFGRRLAHGVKAAQVR